MGSTLCGVSYHLSLDLDIVTFDTMDAQIVRPYKGLLVIVIVIVIVMIARSVLYEDDRASYHGLIARAIHAVDEEVVLTWRCVCWDLDVVVVDVGIALIDRVILVEAKGLRLVITETQVAGVRVSVEVVVDVDLVRLDEIVVREVHLEVDTVVIPSEVHAMILGCYEIDNRFGSIGGLLLASGEGCRQSETAEERD